MNPFICLLKDHDCFNEVSRSKILDLLYDQEQLKHGTTLRTLQAV